MDYIIVFALGILTATLLIRWAARRTINKIMDRLEEESYNAQNAQLRVNLEYDQNSYLLYNSDDGSFVAQGADFAELKQNLVSRFPDRVITVVKGDAGALEKLQKQIATLNSASKNSASL